MEENVEICVVLPPEIIEHIFSFLDAYSLIQIEQICDDWKYMIKRLKKKQSFWEKACLEDMPKKSYLSLSQNLNCDESEKYEVIFRNWISWQNVSTYEHETYDNKINNITCAKISGNHIVYGTLYGVIGVQTDTGDNHHFYETSNKSSVNKLYFMNPRMLTIGDNYYHHSHLLVVYDCEFKLFMLYPELIEIQTLTMRKSLISVYENYICISDNNGHVEVFEIDFEADLPHELLIPITSFRLYRPMVAEHVHIFDKVVTVVTKCRIFKIDFNKYSEKWKIKAGQFLPFPPEEVDRYWTFYHEVVFANGYCDLYVLTIDNKIVSSFNVILCLGAPISEIYYYGNILLITTHSAQVHIYVINDWSTFHLKKHDFKLNLDGSPIMSLDIQEIKDEHRLVITMDERIYQVFLYRKTTENE